jgi:uncharacterized circularly permuted ATP-grasp superfamily protein
VRGATTLPIFLSTETRWQQGWRKVVVRPMADNFDEMNGMTGALRTPFANVQRWLAETPADAFAQKRQEADLMFQRIGITFNVYGQRAGAERLIPFDIIPRVLTAAEW